MTNLQQDWYAPYSKPHKEQQAQFHFGLQGIESFFSRLYLPRSVKKKGQDCKGARGQCVSLWSLLETAVRALAGGSVRVIWSRRWPSVQRASSYH
jgi:hypothetical protein